MVSPITTRRLSFSNSGGGWMPGISGTLAVRMPL
jgi:hypothetical protein